MKNLRRLNSGLTSTSRSGMDQNAFILLQAPNVLDEVFGLNVLERAYREMASSEGILS